MERGKYVPSNIAHETKVVIGGGVKTVDIGKDEVLFGSHDVFVGGNSQPEPEFRDPKFSNGVHPNFDK